MDVKMNEPNKQLQQPKTSSAKTIEQKIPQIQLKSSPEPSKQFIHKPSSSSASIQQFKLPSLEKKKWKPPYNFEQ